MDLRTKLVFGLVAVSLVSMLALGTLAYRNAETLIAQRSTTSLASVAEAKAEQVASVVVGWEEAVALMASRTQLRRSLAEWNAARSADEQERIRRILTDAQESSRFVEGVAVFDARGERVASAGPRDPDGNVEIPESRPEGPVAFLGFTLDEPPGVVYVADLRIEEASVGTLRAILSIDELARVAANRTGLRETGEVLIATRGGADGVRFLTPVRYAASTGATPVEASAGARLLRALLEGGQEPSAEEAVDYRGEPVLVALRRIEGADLGLLVKFDRAEEWADIIVFRGRLIGAGLSLAAFAILLGVAMGFAFAKPIHALALVAGRIRDGDLTARADPDREDELGLLAETFNEMSEELERRMTQLQEFKTFFDQSRDMLCIAGTDGYFKRVNPAFSRTLGWSEGELLGRPFVDFVHPDDADATIRETEQLADGIPTISFRNRYRCKDGTYKELRWTSHPDPKTGNIYASARSPADPEA